jgi:hypothetical protein
MKRPELKYEVTFTNARGEQRHAIVELTPEEGIDLDGFIACAWAAQRAAKGMPDEFKHNDADVQRVVVH